MHELPILTGVLTGFKLRRVGTAGLRCWNSVSVDVTVCQKVLSDQPAVLLLAGSDSRAFSHWKVRFELGISNGKSNNSCMMPFVGRNNTVTDMALAIVDNLEKAKQMQNNNDVVKKYLCLVGSGAAIGAGNTRIGQVLHQCLEGIFNRKVVRVTSAIDNKKSTYHMWLEDVCSEPEMEGLLTVINKDMTLTQLVQATEKYLSNRSMLMFLHLDKFAPFDDAGRTQNTPEKFHHCWRRMLMPIMCSPSIGLYISGHMSYFDTIGRGLCGQPPSSALSVQLDLFTTKIIHKMLEKIFIPLNITGEVTISLSTALDRLFSPISDHTGTSPAQGSWAHNVAQRIHDVTGGVPRFVQHALFALLMNSDMYSTLFKCDGTVHSAALLDKLFNKGGDVYDAVVKAASVHFDSVVAEYVLEKDRVNMLKGLLQLLLFRDRFFALSMYDIDLFSSARSSSDKRPISLLVSYAQFWGIHRVIDRDGERISFAMPSAVVDGLAPALAQWDLEGDSHNVELKAVLTFHQLVAALMPHSNWLGLVEDSEGSVSLPQHPAVPAILSSRTWDLPRLPVVHAHGLLRDVDAVRGSITLGDAACQGMKSNCRPELLGEYLSSLSSTEFHAFSTGPQSSSADFIVRYGIDVSHLLVKNVDRMTFQMVLEKCGKVAPTALASSELQHTLVFVIKKSNVRTQIKQMIGQLSVVDLVQRLEDELRGSKQKGSNCQRMRQAIDLIRKGALNIEVLDDIQYNRFLRYDDLAKHLRCRKE